MPTAAIYVRQSLDRTGEQAAVQRQQAECQALCDAQGWHVVEVYRDNDASASSGRLRPEYRRLLRDLADRRFSVVVAWHPDRLHRRPRELEDFIDLIEAHRVKVVTVQAGHWDLSTPSGRMVARTLGSVARYEVEQKSDRQRSGNRQRAAQGIPHASPRPFGYVRVLDQGKAASLKVEPTEAKALRRAYRQLLAGASLRSIAAELNEAGHKTSKGKPWAAYSVRDRFRSPLYAGLSYYNGEHVGDGTWKAIVPEATWRAAKALLEQPERRTTPGSTRKYMLSGLACCGICGALMATGRTQHGKRTYRCSEHKHLSRAAEPIDEFIEAVVVARLDRPDARELLHDASTPDADDLRDQAQALRAQEEELAVLLADGKMSAKQFEVANARLGTRVRDVEARMQVSHHAEALREIVTGDSAKVWQRLDVDRRRAVVDALMTITLLPPGRGRRTFEPTTVAVHWRD